MEQTKIALGWRDRPEIAAALDQIARDKGIDRSDVIRMMVRNELKATADSK